MDEFDREAICLVADLSAFMPGFAEMNAQRHHTAIIKSFEEFLNTLQNWGILSSKEVQ